MSTEAEEFKTLSIILLCGLIPVGCILIGYALGKNENSVPRYDLQESMYDEIHSYRMCMNDRSCRMFVRIKQ